MKKICPACGRSEEANEFLGAFCPSCYAARHELYSLPRVIELTACPSCGKTPAGEPSGEGAVKKALLSKLRSEHELVKSSMELTPAGRHWRALLKLVFSIAGKRVEKQASVLVRLEKKQCAGCSRRASGYFEAIIQFRSSGEADAERVERKALKAVELLEKTSFVSRVEKLPEGVDVFVGSASEAQKALHALGLSYSVSKKIAGRKQGRIVSRTTFCARV
ncbi:MAG: NMD3-related protein [Candidatus Micrarchaeota archaeon]